MSKLHEIAKKLGLKTTEAMKFIGATSPNQNISEDDEKKLETMTQVPESKVFENTKKSRSIGIVGDDDEVIIIFEHEFAGDVLVNTEVWGKCVTGSRVQAIHKAGYFAVKLHTGNLTKEDLE